MSNQGLMLAVCCLGLALVGCDRSTGQREDGKQVESCHRGSENDRVSQKSAKKSSSTTDLADLKTKIISSGDFSAHSVELKALLLAHSEQMQVEPMVVAAKLISDTTNSDGQEIMLMSVLSAFPDTDSRFVLAKNLPSGRTRSGLVGGLCQKLVEEDDIDGLGRLYDEIQIGNDRQSVAAVLANRMFAKDGFAVGMDFISGLEMPEERYVALMKTLKFWNGSKDEASINRIVGISNMLNPDHQKRIQRMLGRAQ